jgi:hypothetical protein
MTLNLKNYQSFDHKPYCKAHLPKPQASVVSETIESQRLTKVANMVSNIQYRADFIKSKGDAGAFGTVALDAPEIKNSIKSANQVSNAK